MSLERYIAQNDINKFEQEAKFKDVRGYLDANGKFTNKPLLFAVECKNLTFVKLILSRKNVNPSHPNHKALISAYGSGCEEIVSKLLKRYSQEALMEAKKLGDILPDLVPVKLIESELEKREREANTTKILVIDDYFGRGTEELRHIDRENFCINFGIEDITGDCVSTIKFNDDPTCSAIFHRGQNPHIARVGDIVENDLDGILNFIEDNGPFDAIVCDMCFYTGAVTKESNIRNPGVAEGGEHDDINHFGVQVIESLQNKHSEIPVIVCSSSSDIENNPKLKKVAGFLSPVSRTGREDLTKILEALENSKKKSKEALEKSALEM
jgi:hypothetical protein